MYLKKILLILLLCGLFKNLESQQIIEAKLHYGYVLPLYKAIEYVVNSEVCSFDIYLLKQTTGKDYWEILYKYPLYGMGFSFSNLGNNKIYGYATSIYSCFDYSLFRNKGFNLNSRFNFGYSYINKKFNLYDNYLNRAIGSNHNIFIRLSLNTLAKIANNKNLLFDCSFTHYSNGKTKSPNYGLNILTFSLGLRFNIKNYEHNNLYYHDELKQDKIKKFSQFLFFSGGNKVYDNLLNIRYKFFTATYQLNYTKALLKQYGVGISVFYDESIGEAISKDIGIYDNRVNIRFRIGTYLVRSFQFKNVMFNLMLGYYVYSKYTDLTLIYSRMLLQYYFNKRFSLGVGIKAHMAKADMLEWGIGIKL